MFFFDKKLQIGLNKTQKNKHIYNTPNQPQTR